MKRAIGIYKGKKVIATEGLKQKQARESRGEEFRPQVPRRANQENFPGPEIFRNSFIIIN